MRNRAGRFLGMSMFCGGVTLGCIPEATEQEMKAMCENLVKLRGEIDLSDEAELIAEVEEEFKREAKRLKDWKERDLKGWDDELTAKLKALTDDAEKESLKAEYEKKKQITASKHDPGIAALDGKKKAAIDAAKKKAVENRGLYAKAVEECVSKAKKEGVSQKVATCRIKANSTDAYWNACR
jgi:hypothetical protein